MATSAQYYIQVIFREVGIGTGSYFMGPFRSEAKAQSAINDVSNIIDRHAMKWMRDGHGNWTEFRVSGPLSKTEALKRGASRANTVGTKVPASIAEVYSVIKSWRYV